jgi:hypothetical protein
MTDDEEKTEKTKDISSESPSTTDGNSSEHQTVNKEKVYYRQVIKSCWTHEPWLYFKVIVKSNGEMGEYIALHGLVPQNELPLHLRHKIPENEIWMREDIYNDVSRRREILAHEYAELDLMMTYAITYKEAHAQAEFFEHLFYPDAEKL